MIYTKQELIDAFCSVRGCKEDQLPQIKNMIQARLDRQREQLQKELNELPLLAVDEMKKMALRYLNEQANEQSNEESITDNDGVNL